MLRGAKYYYVKNLQGDIISIIDSSGATVCTYAYDAWGNILSIKDASGSIITDENHIANQNPFRYRGYYYDTETGLYYVSSRYYDPETCRFINADTIELITATPNALTDKNLFAYCDNNPVMRVDRGGQFWDTVFDIVSLGFSVSDVISSPKDPWAWAGLVGDVVDLVPFVTGVGETVKVAKTANNVCEIVDTAHDVSNVVDNVTDTAKQLHRPYIRKSTRQAVEAAAPKMPDGRFMDPNMHTPINGKYDLGHVTGHEFSREANEAMRKGWSQKQFNNYMNDPRFYQIEDPHWNRSRRFEMR